MAAHVHVNYIMDHMLMNGCVQMQVHYIMDEMLMNGCVVDTNKANILEPVQLLETVEK